MLLDRLNNQQDRLEKSDFIPTLNDLIFEQIIKVKNKARNQWKTKLRYLADHHKYKDAETLFQLGSKPFREESFELQHLSGLLRLRKTLRNLTRSLDSKNSSLAQVERESQLSTVLTAFLYPVNESRNEETEESQIAK